jgi:hypothetical protein
LISTCGSGSGGFDDQKLEKFTSVKLLYNFWIENCNLPILTLGLHKGHTSYRRSLQPSKREHPALQNMKIHYFFLYLWVISALLDPDPDPATQINADP